MRGANFVSFFTACGFFIAIVFAMLKAQSAWGLLSYTFLITLFFYLFSHVFVAFYVNTLTSRPTFFPKMGHEKDLDFFIREINKRETAIDSQYEHRE